jgi:hypothetical protein
LIPTGNERCIRREQPRGIAWQSAQILIFLDVLGEAPFVEMTEDDANINREAPWEWSRQRIETRSLHFTSKFILLPPRLPDFLSATAKGDYSSPLTRRHSHLHKLNTANRQLGCSEICSASLLTAMSSLRRAQPEILFLINWRKREGHAIRSVQFYYRTTVDFTTEVQLKQSLHFFDDVSIFFF